MSAFPVTNHPAFTSARSAFAAAHASLSDVKRPGGGWELPPRGAIARAIELGQAGIKALQPHTEVTDAWIHNSAFSAIANAKQSIAILADLNTRLVNPADAPNPSAVPIPDVVENRELLSQASIGFANAVEAAAKFAAPTA